jgi:MYXO-CTERM domain-containing protein
MRRFLVLSLFLVGGAASAFAVSAPEIDSSSAMGALTLLAGALLVFRGRRRS